MEDIPKSRKKPLTEEEVRAYLDLCRKKLELRPEFSPDLSEAEREILIDRLYEQEEEIDRQMDEIRFSYYRNARSDRFGCRKKLVAKILEKVGPEYDKAIIRKFLEETDVLSGGE